MMSLIGNTLHLSQFLFGFVLLILGLVLLAAKLHDPLREWVERIFFDGKYLFAEGESYTKKVKFLNQCGIVGGIGILIPTKVIWDIVGVLAVLILWNWLQNMPKPAFWTKLQNIRKSARSEPKTT